LRAITKVHSLTNSNEEKVLVQLGFSPSQARVYLVLAQKGPSSVNSIAQNSGIHRTHLYEILKSLKDRGFVQKQLVGSLYVATPLREAAQTLVKDKREEILTLENQITELVNSLPKESEAYTSGKNELLLSNSKTFTFSKGQKYIDAAHSQVDHMHTWKRFTQLWEIVEGHMMVTMNRGIKVRQITEIPTDISQAIRFLNRPVFKNANIEIRFVNRTGGNVSIVDNERVFLSTSQDKENVGESPLLFSNYPGLLGLMRNYYEYCWEHGYRLENGKLVLPNVTIVNQAP
jgi:sugar-specific transcriptional regulator TrmB